MRSHRASALACLLCASLLGASESKDAPDRPDDELAGVGGIDVSPKSSSAVPAPPPRVPRVRPTGERGKTAPSRAGRSRRSSSTPQAATTVALGETVAGDIATGETDSYVVAVPAGVTVFFDALSSSNTNGLNWRIDNRYGRVELSHTTAFQDGGPVRLVGGDYTISVFGEGGTQTGSYSFRIVDASPESATIALGGVVSGTIDVPGDSDVYTFAASAGQLVYLDRIATSNSAGLNWRLEDSFGRRILDTTADLNDQGRFTLIGGSYTLTVLGEISSGQGQTGTYQLQIVPLVDGDGSITIGTLVSGAIDQAGQEDRFHFTAPAGQRIFLDRVTAPNSAGLNWSLEDANGRLVVAPQSSLDDAGPFTLLGGDYTLKVFGEISAGTIQTGSYEFRVVGLTQDQSSIAIGDPVSGEVTIGQQDRYTFTATVGQRILLDRTAASNSAGLNWMIEDSFGRTVLPRTASLDDTGPIPLMGGSYVLSVLGESSIGQSQTGTYTFRIVDVGDDTAPIALAGTASGTIDLGESDRYTFTAPAGQIVTLVLVSSSNSAGLNWSLEDAYGRAILPRTASLANQGPFTLVGGSYTIEVVGEVSSGAAQTGSYSFTLRNDGIDTSYVPSGTPIALGQIVDTAIGAPGAPDLYRLTVGAGENVYFDLQLGASTLRWTLFDPVGRAVFGPATANFAATQNQGPFVLAAGAYTLRIEDTGTATPPYRFQVWDVQDASASTAVGTTVSTAFATPGAVHTFSLPVSGGAKLYFDNLLAASGSAWSLVDPVGQTVFSNVSMSGTTTGDAGPYTLAAGTYQLVVDPTNDLVPAYSFVSLEVTDVTATIAVGDVVGGSLATPGAVNRYTIDIGAGQRIYADIQTAASGLSWSMFDPVGQPVFAGVSANSTISGDQGPVTLVAGTYAIELRSTLGATSTFQFRVWDVQDELLSAPLGVQVAGAFTDPGATHAFDVTIATNGDAAYFDNQAGATSLFWTLDDPGGQPVFADVAMSSATSADRGPYTLLSGTYRLRLRASGGALPTYLFTPWGSTHPVETLAFGTPIVGDIPSAGSTHTYTFTALEGQKLLFDLTADTTGLRWTLVDPVGVSTGLIDNATANDADTEDRGPLVLEAGTYRLILDGDATATPHYEFIVYDLAHDLEIAAFTLTPPVLADGETGRSILASWTVRNAGGLAIPGSWVDRIYLSADATFGNADDLFLGQFPSSGPLAANGTLMHSETLSIPDTLALGSYLLFLVADADGQVDETLSEDDNVGDRPLVVAVSGLPEPGLKTVRTFGPITFSGSQFGNSVRNIDYPLEEVVSLTDVRFVAGDAFRWEFTGSSTPATLSLWLMNGTTEVARVGANRFSGGITIPTEVVARLGRDLTPAEIATLPSTVVDGIRFKIETSSGGGTNTSRILSTHADGKLRLQLVTCEFAPCGPHRKEEFFDLAGIDWSFSAGSPTPWQEYDLSRPVPVHGLRFVFAAPWVWTWSIFDGGPPQASVEVQVILNDGSSLTLDDWISPSVGSGPPEQLIPSGHSLMLDEETQQAHDGLWILGFRWRLHACCTLGFSVHPGCPAAVSFCSAAPSPLRLYFLYDFGECTGEPALAAVDVSPPSGSSFPAPSRVVLSGTVSVPDSTVPIAAVLVDGEPVDSLDAAGRFFKVVDVALGDNTYVVEVIQPGCGQATTEVHLTGVEPEEAAFVNLADVSNQVTATYRNTTFHRAADLLVMDVIACNTGDTSILGPLQMVVTRITDPAVIVARPEGLTPDGKPFVLVSDFGGADRLDPGECAAPKKLAFHNPKQAKVSFEVQWRAPTDGAPYFTTAPRTRADAGDPYAYDADAEDPDGDTLTYALVRGPAGMTVDSVTGLVAWTPAASDQGSHQVVIRAADGLGGSATQSFTLEVGDGSTNSPPYFTSAPPTRAGVGARYAYQATAVDADGDGLTFALASAPPGAVVDPGTGLVTWDFALPGNHAVELRADDGAGGVASQRWVLSVGSPAANPTIPQLYGSPGSVATVGDLYIYQPVVDNPDAGETVQFDLPTAPAGLSVDPVSGRVSWTPMAGQVGAHDVELTVDDGNGGTASQTWTIEVSTTLANRPPFVDSIPELFAVLGQPYHYAVHATDPEGGPVTYTLIAPPAGMTIDPATGLLTWTPGATGSVSVAIRAADALDAHGAQVYTLDVIPPNAAPAIGSPAPTEHAKVGGVWQHDVQATDPEGQELLYRLQQAPPGMTIHGQTGLISWRPHQAQVGSHPVTVVVQDPYFASASQSFVVIVDADLTAPVVALRLSAPQVAIGQQAQVCVEATDDVGLVRRTLLVDGAPVALDLLGCFILTYEDPRTVALRAEAADAGGNVSVDEDVLLVVDPSAGTKPEVETSSIVPPPESVITTPTPIHATITDDTPQFLTWTVRIARAGTEEFTTIGSGSGAVSNAVVATLDPTLLANDVYRVQIVGDDALQTGGVEFRYSIAGELKLGNFRMTFTDLTMPVAGIPIAVTRQYDSLDSAGGDFGPGWRLGLPGKVSDGEAESAPGDPIGIFLDTPFTTNTRVYVTRPDGRRVGFTFAPIVAGGFTPFQLVSAFAPDAGVTDTLEAISATGATRLWAIGGRFYEFVLPYNPRTYVLTTKEGLRYTIDEFDGLKRIEDLNGNTLTVTPQGLVSSTGVTLTFERDAAGRIQRILEPDDPNDADPPGEIEYLYDGQGRLTGFRDQLDQLTEYFYEVPGHPHYLSRIEDPLDTPIVRSVFDAQGRLVAQCGAQGDIVTLDGCNRFTHDPLAGIQTIVNGRGFRKDLLLDARGNVRFERAFVDVPPNLANYLETERVYDANDNEIAVIDPDGNTWTYTYDERGNRTSRTDPSGARVWRTTYNECEKVDSEVDPAGNVTAYEYDDRCNLRFVKDALGGTSEVRYNARGQVSLFLDPEGNDWTFQYDAAGFASGVTDPLGNTETLHKNANGEVEWQIDRNGRRIDLSYDAAHRPVEERWDDGRVITYAYNPAGNLESAVTHDSALSITYWNTGLVKDVETTSPGAPSVTVSYGFFDGSVLQPGYDANGNVTAVVDSLGGETRYEYDALDRLARVEQSPGAGIAPKRVDLGHDGAGLLRTLARFADLGATHGVATTDYDYECGGCPLRLTSIDHRRATDGAVLHALDLVRDAAGNAIGTTDAEGGHAYAYDGLRRLLAADHPPGGAADETYAYDSAGNRTHSHSSAAYTYSYMLGLGGNQLRQDAAYDYAYDDNGNLSRRTDRSSGAYSTYVYDHRDRLLEVRQFTAGGAPTGTVTYRYDGAGRRIRSERNGAVRHFVYDGRNPILEVDGTGTPVVRRLYSRQLDGILADEIAGQTRWFLNGPLGTVRDLVGNDASTLNHYTYESFGRVVSETQPASANELRFTGREFDPVSGLGHYRAREYDPAIGRFIQEDSRIPFRYEYAECNPNSFLDPTGESAILEYAMFACDIIEAADFANSIGQTVNPVFRAVADVLNGIPIDAEAVQRQFLEGLLDVIWGVIPPCGLPVPPPGP
jgi:RHS repeat-associated protein